MFVCLKYDTYSVNCKFYLWWRSDPKASNYSTCVMAIENNDGTINHETHYNIEKLGVFTLAQQGIELGTSEFTTPWEPLRKLVYHRGRHDMI